VTLLTVALLLAAACSAEQKVDAAPNPQKSALRMCVGSTCAPPVLVVDGRLVDFESAELNPHDIDLVEIMKGDSAVARFGEAARGGVVIVTSKRSTKSPTTAQH
jgi:hypothetical protein